MKRWRAAFVVSVVIALVLYLGAVVATDFDRTMAALARIGPATWALVLGLSIVNYLIRFFRWRYYLREMTPIRIPDPLHFVYYLAGFSLSTTPGKAGEAIRSVYLHKHGVTWHQSVSALFVERLLDLLSITILSVLACAYFPEYRWIATATVVLVVGLLVLVHQAWALDWIDAATRRFGRSHKFIHHVIVTLRSAVLLLKTPQLIFGLVMGVLAWGCEGIGFHLALNAIGVDTDALMAVSIYGISVLVGAVSFLPGGLGGTEAVMSLLLIAVGADGPSALAATIVCRFATLWFAVILGLISMAGLELSKRGDNYKKAGTNQ